MSRANMLLDELEQLTAAVNAFNCSFDSIDEYCEKFPRSVAGRIEQIQRVRKFLERNTFKNPDQERMDAIADEEQASIIKMEGAMIHCGETEY